jgi:hypothetical protein
MIQNELVKIKLRIFMAKAAFNKKIKFFHKKITLKFKEQTSKVLHFENRSETP